MRCQHGIRYTDSCADCDLLRDNTLKALRVSKSVVFEGSFINSDGRRICYECSGYDGEHMSWCKSGRGLAPSEPLPEGVQPKPAEPVYFPKSRIDEKLTLPTDSVTRKGMPVASGAMHYFPRALAYLSMISKLGNDKHNPGEPLHWSKEKSYDHLDCIARHLIDAGKRGDGGMRESGYLFWRAAANLECELEAAEARGEGW